MGFPIATEIFKAAAAAHSTESADLAETAGFVDSAGRAGAAENAEALGVFRVSDASGGSGASNASNTRDALDSVDVDDGAIGADRVVEISPVQLATGRWSRWIAVAGGFGYVPVAPGTAGSLAGVLVFWIVGMSAAAAAVPGPGFVALYALVVASLLLVGTHAAGRAEIDFGRRDDGRIVIDEVVGQLIALAPLVPLLWAIETGRSATTLFVSASGPLLVDGFALTNGFSTQDVSLFFFEVVTGFVLFRLFDVWKPGAIRWAERRFHGGLGVMADDVMAGIHAALCLFVLHSLVFERFYSEWLVATRPVSSVSWLGASSWLGVSGIGVSL